jgi:hypothetical protein
LYISTKPHAGKISGRTESYSGDKPGARGAWYRISTQSEVSAFYLVDVHTGMHMLSQWHMRTRRGKSSITIPNHHIVVA